MDKIKDAILEQIENADNFYLYDENHIRGKIHAFK